MALAVYYYANAAGIVHVPQGTMAEHCHIDSKTFSRAITVLKRLGLLRGFRTSRRSAEILAMNIGGLTWSAARQQARERRRLAQATNLDLDFETPSGGHTPPLDFPSGGHTPPPRAVRTGATTTTRGEPTERQVAYALDLGVEVEGKDSVQLGSDIELAARARTDLRDAARNKQSPTPDPATTNGRRLTAVQRRRLAEAQRTATPRVEQPPPADPVAAAAGAARRSYETAAAIGWHVSTSDPTLLIGPGGRSVRIAARVPAPEGV